MLKILRQNICFPHESISQVSIRACPKTLLPKTLTSVQLQPKIAELFPAMVTYSASNHSLQYKNITLFLSLVLSNLFPKTRYSSKLGPTNLIIFFFAEAKRNNTGFLKVGNS